MYQVPGLKLISVDGVIPSDESIGNGTYPFLNTFYLVIREDEKEDSETMKLYKYILSDKGKEALIKKGTNKESSPLIEKFKIERDMISQELIKKTNELKSAYLDISN